MELIEFPHPTVEISCPDLEIEKARQFVATIILSHYTRFIRCERMTEGEELIYFEIEPEMGQMPKIDIRYVEPLVVQFSINDEFNPWVYALRKDFPFVSHLNAMGFELPRCLCLYEITWDELKISWRANGFLERIREWLELTSEDRLHQEDQPLEAFMLETVGSIILPKNLKENEPIHVYRLDDQTISIRVSRVKQDSLNSESHFVVMKLTTSPQVHGYLRKTPRNLLELNDLLDKLGIDLIEGNLKAKLRELNIQNNSSQYRNFKLVIVVSVPKLRNTDDLENTEELTSFIFFDTLLDIALKTQFLVEAENKIVIPVPTLKFEEESAIHVQVVPIRTYEMLDKTEAKNLSGIDANEIEIGLIGLGALGSQVFEVLSRMGFGTWKLLDNDFLLPHNLVRHSLHTDYVGCSKVKAIAYNANNLFFDETHSQYLHADYLNSAESNLIEKHFENTKLIIDASASISVARDLARNNKIKARRISAFLNPQGSDIVLLVEPENRSVKLDHIEMQYYRMLWQTIELNQHLEVDGAPVRYSTSCRDITSKIKQEDVTTMSGICAKAIRNCAVESNGMISIWQGKPDGSVQLFKQELFPTHKYNLSKWTIVLDDYLTEKIFSARKSKLPNETGGILLGTYDQVSKTIYIVDTILSPKGSVEFPSAYYRGIDGVEYELNRLSEITANNLQYIGEWHSHPKNSSVQRSSDDLILFEWIKEFMNRMSLPPLMIIAGDDKKLGIYIES